MSAEKLLRLQSENDAARAEMLLLAPRFDKIKGTTPRAVSAFNLFQTPKHIAQRMADMIPNSWDRPKVLEPSAGLGNLYRAVLNKYGHYAEYHLVENNPECMAELYRQGGSPKLHQRDFLSWEPGQLFDVIIMNPPFKQGRDIKHIAHALGLLNPGGFLVALCANGPKQNEQLKAVSDTWEVLPEKSFKSEGTNVSVSMLTITQ